MPKEELVIWNFQFIHSSLHCMVALCTNLDVIFYVFVYLLATLSTQGMVCDAKVRLY